MKKTHEFFSKEDEQRIVKAIKEAELNTSGEIRVHLESKAEEPNLEHAKKVFETVGMTDTKLRNGVLFYLALEDKQFSIVGDSGIDNATGADFWDSIRNVMQDYFRKGEFTEGLVQGITMAGQALKTYFPYQDDDINELPDEISKS